MIYRNSIKLYIIIMYDMNLCVVVAKRKRLLYTLQQANKTIVYVYNIIYRKWVSVIYRHD